MAVNTKYRFQISINQGAPTLLTTSDVGKWNEILWNINTQIDGACFYQSLQSTGELSFCGDAYETLLALDVCDQVEIIWEYSCDDFATVNEFSRFNFKTDNIIFDCFNCVATVSISRNSTLDKITESANKEFTFDVFGSARMRQIVTGGIVGEVDGSYVLTLLQDIAERIVPGVSVTSDVIGDPAGGNVMAPESWGFTAPSMNAGDQLTLTFTGALGTEYDLTIDNNSGGALTPGEVSEYIAQGLAYKDFESLTNENVGFQCTTDELLSRATALGFDPVTGAGNIDTWYALTAIDGAVNGAPFAITQNSAFVWSLGGVSITPAGSQGDTIKTNWGDLMQMLCCFQPLFITELPSGDIEITSFENKFYNSAPAIAAEIPKPQKTNDLTFVKNSLRLQQERITPNWQTVRDDDLWFWVSEQVTVGATIFTGFIIRVCPATGCIPGLAAGTSICVSLDPDSEICITNTSNLTESYGLEFEFNTVIIASTGTSFTVPPNSTRCFPVRAYDWALPDCLCVTENDVLQINIRTLAPAGALISSPLTSLMLNVATPCESFPCLSFGETTRGLENAIPAYSICPDIISCEYQEEYYAQPVGLALSLRAMELDDDELRNTHFINTGSLLLADPAVGDTITTAVPLFVAPDDTDADACGVCTAGEFTNYALLNRELWYQYGLQQWLPLIGEPITVTAFQFTSAIDIQPGGPVFTCDIAQVGFDLQPDPNHGAINCVIGGKQCLTIANFRQALDDGVITATAPACGITAPTPALIKKASFSLSGAGQTISDIEVFLTP